MESFVGVLLAGGMGKRMHSELPKTIHHVAGSPMIDHAIGTLASAGATRTIVVVGYKGELIEDHLAGRAQIVWQHEQLGTGHAAMQAIPALETYEGVVLVVPGDVALLRTSTVQSLVEQHVSSGCSATLLTMILEDPAAYGRVIRDSNEKVTSIIEYRDASEEIRAVREVNTGVYCFDCQELIKALPKITDQNDQREYYLTDVIGVFVAEGKPVGAMALNDPLEGLGINSRVELAQAEQVLRCRKRIELMEQGVTIVDPSSTHIDMGVQVGHDTVIQPFTVLSGQTSIGKSCNIGPYVCINDGVCGDFCNIGPFSYIRPGTILADKVKVGDFVEVKNSNVGHGTKIPHLSYVGDANLGSGVNIGAGTITCNYDGVVKNRTTVEDGAFVGANSNLVAPVRVGREAYIATGSTVTSDVPAGALGIARARQENKDGWVARRRAAQASKEDNK